MQPVIVYWLDAHQGEGYWHSLDDDDKEPHVIKSAGFLIPETDGGKPGHVTLAQNVDPNDLVDHVIYIPVKMVERILGLRPFDGEGFV